MVGSFLGFLNERDSKAGKIRCGKKKVKKRLKNLIAFVWRVLADLKEGIGESGHWFALRIAKISNAFDAFDFLCQFVNGLRDSCDGSGIHERTIAD